MSQNIGYLMTKDLRKYASQTTFRIVIGAIILLFAIGTLAIWLIYGPSAALMGFLCLLGAFVPIGLIALAIWGLDWIVRKGNE